jgi:hypothetical protein
MNRRDVVRALAGLAIVPALKATPSEGSIVVTKDERHSYIWAVEKCREVGRARVHRLAVRLSHSQRTSETDL